MLIMGIVFKALIDALRQEFGLLREQIQHQEEATRNAADTYREIQPQAPIINPVLSIPESVIDQIKSKSPQDKKDKTFEKV